MAVSTDLRVIQGIIWETKTKGVSFVRNTRNIKDIIEEIISYGESFLFSAEKDRVYADNTKPFDAESHERVVDANIRAITLECVGMPLMRKMMDEKGVLKLDTLKMNILINLLEHYAVNTYNKNSSRLEAMKYITAGRELESEIGLLHKNAPSSVLKMSLEGDTMRFDIQNKPYSIMGKGYAPYFVEEKGYKNFVIEKNDLAMICALATFKDMSFNDAEEYLKNSKGGLFFRLLDKEYEIRAAKRILSGDFSLLDGELAESYFQYDAMCRKKFSGKVASNYVYNCCIKPMMMAFMGRVAIQIKEDLNTTCGANFYYAMPERIVLKVPVGVSIEDALPRWSSKAKEVGDFDFKVYSSGLME